MSIIEWLIPLRTTSEANSREFWAVKAKRHAAQKARIAWEFKMQHHIPEMPCEITMTRIAPRRFDFDNLVSSFKYIRDAIAECLTGCKQAGRADDDPRLTWHYKQEKGAPKEYAIKIAFS